MAREMRGERERGEEGGREKGRKIRGEEGESEG